MNDPFASDVGADPELSATPKPRNNIVTLDGPAGAGKSSTARRLAEVLGFFHLDTGALYRAITVACLRKGIRLSDEEVVARYASEQRIDFDDKGEVRLNGEPIGEAIRSPEVSAAVSVIAANKRIRDWLIPIQRRLARGHRGVVAEGRDLATVVFPDARFQFYIDANADERARRRSIQLRENGREDVDQEEILVNLKRRDHLDSTREHAPLVEGERAHRVDTTDMSLDEVVERLRDEIDRLSRG